jgi:hypothetical protein
MINMSRRGLPMGAAALTAGGLARPYIANAAAKTATVWITQGFVQAEDQALKKTAEDYMKVSGNTLEYSIMPQGSPPIQIAPNPFLNRG